MIPIKKHTLFITIGLFLFWATPLLAQPAQPVGRTLMTREQVVAIDVEGNTRPITRRSEIFAGEKIVTSANGFAHVRMVDGAIIALGEESEFSLNNYTFDGAGGNPDKAVFELIRGSIRIITGMIGDSDEDEYQLITQAATIGQSDAAFECAIELAKLYCGVQSGSITMSNPQSSIDLGLGGNWDYAEVEFAPVPITPLLSRPPVLDIQFMTGATQSFQSTQTPQSNTQSAPTNGPTTPQGQQVDFPVPQPIQVTPYKKPP